ncbi:serine/threonine-protein kinase [Mycobacterium talmoniae]|uniref:non-specific serine/threonine protein kinase n=1 Tax=Mycobacterium talmoniae TaxID=1858794 RepID=A0A1S1NN74_9MYCO|nr:MULTISPECIES: serine/threonine-protein kinase [Mycobacterium]OHV06300.1 hypothetical protein BKN37_02590 [Mycobacterium talmoniae]PQM48883.1 Serine/threonine-protein kinase PknD [Mycobacterium talmoniae]TDH57578.1 protein kinase [Mycobacterium eburneum]
MTESGRLAPGAVFAGYTIERVLGGGGMGTVYVAAHPRLPRRVALKLLHLDLTRDDYVRSRFESEAGHVARLEHPNIVGVYDTGREGNQLWIAMQYIEGSSAGDALRSGGPLAPEQAVRVIGETAKALDYAHGEGVLHRDVKPDNILLEQDRSNRAGRVLLADFGIAKALAETSHLTRTGMLVASLQYAAPEQFDGEALDERTDVYALGCTLFHLLTGRPPYPGTSLPELMRGHLMTPVPQASAVRPGLAPAWDAVFMRSLAKSRQDRFPSCGALAEAATAVVAQRGVAAPLPDIGHAADTLLAPTPTLYAEQTLHAQPAQTAAVAAWPSHQPSAPTDVRSIPAPRPRWPRRLLILGAVIFLMAGLIAGVVGYRMYKSAHPPALPPPPGALPSLRGTDVRVDAAGNLYVRDDTRLLKLPAGSTTPQELPALGIGWNSKFAVDNAGNVYATNPPHVVKLPAGSTTPQDLPFPEFYLMSDLTVDSAGTVYAALDGIWTRLSAGSNTPQHTSFLEADSPGFGAGSPERIAVDSEGNIYFSCSRVKDGETAVMKVEGQVNWGPVGATLPYSFAKKLPFTGLKYPGGVAVDRTGNVYTTDSANARVLKLPAGSNTPEVLPFTELRYPEDVAVDADGNVYVGDLGGWIVKLAAR